VGVTSAVGRRRRLAVMGAIEIFKRRTLLGKAFERSRPIATRPS
jgi:hypothetical protein